MSFKDVIIKRDFVTELVKTLAKNRGVQISTQKLISERDVLDVVVKVWFPSNPMDWESGGHNQRATSHRITAREIYAYGTDACYIGALDRCNHALDNL